MEVEQPLVVPVPLEWLLLLMLFLLQVVAQAVSEAHPLAVSTHVHLVAETVLVMEEVKADSLLQALAQEGITELRILEAAAEEGQAVQMQMQADLVVMAAQVYYS